MKKFGLRLEEITKMLFAFIIPAFVAAFGLLGLAKPLEERQSSGKPFNLYAYGEGIPGLPVFYADGWPSMLIPIVDSLTYLVYRSSSNW